MEKQKRRTFTPEFKAEAVALVKSSGRSVGDVARDLGVWRTVLGKWVEQSEIDLGRGAPGALTSAEKDELAKLRRENRQLREEREILKKAAAFFANEKK